jgi:hypothetical protein
MTKIYINDSLIDIGDFQYEMSLSISDLTEINKRTSGKSIILEVPATETNRNVFEVLDSNVIAKTNTAISGRLETDGFVASGTVKIYGSKNKNGNATYRFQLVFDNVNWIDAIGDDAIGDLDWSDQDHDFSASNIITSWTKSNDRSYVYPVVDLGEQSVRVGKAITKIELTGIAGLARITIDGFTYDVEAYNGETLFEVAENFISEYEELLESRNIKVTRDLYTLIFSYYVSSPTIANIPLPAPLLTGDLNGIKTETTSVVFKKYFRPALNIKDTLDKIYSGIGYKVESSFLNTNFFKNLYLYSPNYEKVPRNSDYGFKSGVGTISNIQTINNTDAGTDVVIKMGNTTSYDFYDNGTFDNSTYLWKPEKALKVYLTVVFNYFLSSTNSHDVDYIIGDPSGSKKTGTLLEAGESVGFHTKTITRELDIASTDDIGFYLTINASESTLILNTNFKYNKYPTEDPNGWVYTSMETSEIFNTDVGNYYRDLLQVDLIKGLKQMFNLYFYTNTQEKTLYIEPFDDFYTGASRDWSDKVDISKMVSLRYIENAKNINFKYLSDSSDTLLKNRSDNTLGIYRHVQSNIGFSGDDDIKNNIFSPTINKKPGEKSNISSVLDEYSMPKITQENKPGDKALSVNYRILYYDKLQSTDSWNLDGTTATQLPFFYFYNDLEDNNNSLRFNSNGFAAGLFTKYYDGLFKIYDGVYESNTYRIPQKMELYLNLNESDIGNIFNTVRNKDFRACVYFDQEKIRGHYYIQEIQNYNPDGGSTKCTLIRVLDRDAGFNLAVDAVLGDYSPADFNEDFFIG